MPSALLVFPRSFFVLAHLQPPFPMQLHFNGEMGHRSQQTGDRGPCEFGHELPALASDARDGDPVAHRIGGFVSLPVNWPKRPTFASNPPNNRSPTPPGVIL